MAVVLGSLGGAFRWCFFCLGDDACHGRSVCSSVLAMGTLERQWHRGGDVSVAGGSSTTGVGETAAGADSGVGVDTSVAAGGTGVVAWLPAF